MAFLKVYTNGEERTVFLGEEPVVLGRGEDTGVLLKDLKASRHHCVIEPVGDGTWAVRDLGSGNGTKVNGTKVDAKILAPEDVVQVGAAKIVFAGEAAAVVTKPAPDARAPAPPQEERRRRRPARSSSKAPLVIGVLLVAALGVLGFVWQSSNGTTQPEERAPTAGELLRASRENVDGDAPEDPARDAEAEARLAAEQARETLFAELMRDFRGYVETGQYGRAREMWFFLRGDPAWEPIPDTYVQRIVDAMVELENRASAHRSRLFNEVGELEALHDFESARDLLAAELSRFEGTSVERSLRERLASVRETLRQPAADRPPPKTLVRRDTRRELQEALALLSTRDFAGVAKTLDLLAASNRAAKGYAELRARADEVAAAAALHDALVAALAQGELPKTRLLKKYKVTGGGPGGLQVTAGGDDHDWKWTDAPGALYAALLDRHVDAVPDGRLGLVVATHALGGGEPFLAALARAYDEDRGRTALDAFVAARVRDERPPEGGYVVHGGEILSRKEYLRKEEEALIRRFQKQLADTAALIRQDPALKKLARLKKKKDALDAARAHALALIFDEKKYFYPYRGTGREGEYNKVQQEVDARVALVRDAWLDRATVKITPASGTRRALKLFDEAFRELDERLVDVGEIGEEVRFLRTYFGKKFDVRSFYRTEDERDLLKYSREVMAWNPTVDGDITEIEREQVRITNEYRMMFGRWPVRIVENLVLSSRGHCSEMSRLGYFGHFSPTPGRRTPYDRMKLAGYEWGASENCTMGPTTAQGAHDSWAHSSGHHRNLLMEPWTEMGTGQHGRYMTQNFGRAPRWSKDDPKPDETERRRRDADDGPEPEDWWEGPEIEDSDEPAPEEKDEPGGDAPGVFDYEDDEEE